MKRFLFALTTLLIATLQTSFSLGNGTNRSESGKSVNPLEFPGQSRYFDASKELDITLYLTERFKRQPFRNDGEKRVRIEATVLTVSSETILAASNALLANNRIPVDFPRTPIVDRAFQGALEFDSAKVRQLRGIMKESGNPNWINQTSNTTVFVLAKPAGQSRQILPNGASSDVLRFEIEAMCTGALFSHCVKIADFSVAH